MDRGAIGALRKELHPGDYLDTDEGGIVEESDSQDATHPHSLVAGRHHDLAAEHDDTGGEGPASWLQGDTHQAQQVVPSLNFAFTPNAPEVQSQGHPLLSLPVATSGDDEEEVDVDDTDEKKSRKRKVEASGQRKDTDKKKKRYTCSKCHGWLIGDVCPGKPCNGGVKCKAPWKHPNGYQLQLNKWVAASPAAALQHGGYLTEEQKLKVGVGEHEGGGDNGDASQRSDDSEGPMEDKEAKEGENGGGVFGNGLGSNSFGV